jgi:type II secretory pathway pseudopilin PulG
MILTLLILSLLSALGLYLWGRGDGIRVERARQSEALRQARCGEADR